MQHICASLLASCCADGSCTLYLLLLLHVACWLEHTITTCNYGTDCHAVRPSHLTPQIDHWLTYTFPTRVREPASILKYRGQTQARPGWLRNGACPAGAANCNTWQQMQPVGRPARVASSTLHDTPRRLLPCRTPLLLHSFDCPSASHACRRSGSCWSSTAATTKSTSPAARTPNSASLAGVRWPPCRPEWCTSSRACMRR